MNPVSKLFRSPLFNGLFVGILVFFGVIGLRSTGSLESLELTTYDWYIRLQPEVIKENKGRVPQPADQKRREHSKGFEASDQKPPPPVSSPLYQPPLRGAPGGRVGGGSRGIAKDLTTLLVLAPNHVALTVQEQPVLYWYLSKPAQFPIELTIIREKDTIPLLEKRILHPSRSGIYPLRLSDFDISLSTGTPYRWFLALIPDPNRRTRDIVAGALIERVETPETLRSKLLKASREEIPHVYAGAGMWYDAIMAVSNLIDDTPNNLVFHKQRAALLEQVGLSAVAQYDLKQELTGQ
jgi:hypothetical protein